MQLDKWLSLETKEGTALTAHGRTVTPVAQVLSLRTPFGGFVWNRPVAVLIGEGGKMTRLPIVDVTRLALWAMAGGSLLSTLIAGMLHRRSTPLED